MVYPVTVLVLTPSVGGHYFGELLAGLVREVARAEGRVVLVQTQEANTPTDEENEPSDFATRVAWAEVDGVVSITAAVSASYLQQLRDAGKPAVLASTRLAGFEAPVALPDNQGGTVAAVEHLIAHGHTRIGFVGNLAQPDVHDRYAAYLKALAAHELLADPTLVFAAPNNSWAGGVRAAHDVLESPDRPTALMVATDRNAIGLMRTLTDAGLAIPGDIAVMGFDNIEEGAFSTPRCRASTSDSTKSVRSPVGSCSLRSAAKPWPSRPTSCRPRRSSFEVRAGAPRSGSAMASRSATGRSPRHRRSCVTSSRTRSAACC